MPPSASSGSIRAGSAQSKELLSSPLNLVLLAATADERASLEFSSPKDLFDRFYDRSTGAVGATLHMHSGTLHLVARALLLAILASAEERLVLLARG